MPGTRQDSLFHPEHFVTVIQEKGAGGGWIVRKEGSQVTNVEPRVVQMIEELPYPDFAPPYRSRAAERDRDRNERINGRTQRRIKGPNDDRADEKGESDRVTCGSRFPLVRGTWK